ncbi:VOC family protein [Propylenella binzhouense]|uniref:VOC family protein n=1 Tax=Propylenella binzhouense TaxID=2555902 RepID=A0A964T498_9HYPH|nr:VOC family protein [Propylenella binzhouense]
MIDHIGLGFSDFAAARRFYVEALAPLGIGVVMEVTKAETGGSYEGAGLGSAGKPFFWVRGGGRTAPKVHIAFAAEDRASVDAFHAAALAAGGRDNGAPGLRPDYHPNYYAAFVLDPDGHNIEAVCHKPA